MLKKNQVFFINISALRSSQSKKKVDYGIILTASRLWNALQQK